MSRSIVRALVLAVLAVAAPIALGASDVTVPLVFQPQESVADNDVPSFPPSMLDKPIALMLSDARGGALDKIGQGTDDDDKVFAYRSARPVGEFVQSVATELLLGSGVRVDPAAPLQLKLRLTSFSIDESNKPVGSMYGGVVKFAYTLEFMGQTISEGASEGSARRYGKSASTQNVAEVLSDATKQGLANVLAEPGFQAAWASGVKSATPSQDSIEAKLERLDALLEGGKISPEEHARARADVLKGI